ncbi:MAG TPA: peptidase M48 [Rhodospirillaceae bacterium]|nr:peptidase M48 [Rhodospirillaceae bacterium]
MKRDFSIWHTAFRGEKKELFPKRQRLKVWILFLLFTFAFPSSAHAEKLSFIRDAEIEHYLHELSTPIFRAAKLNPRAVNLLIIKNGEMNAFVAGGQNIFIYTGLLQSAETPGQLQGVIAHETGHIAGGHLVRGSRAMENASAQSMIGMLAALAAGLASGNGQVAIGAFGAAQSITERNLMSYSRAQESAADSAALRFLDSTEQSSEGFYDFMKKLAGQELIPEDQQSQYVRTHPMSQDRLQNIGHHLENSPYANKKMPALFNQMHERMQAKLLGFLRPEAALLRYTDKDPRIRARYARAIALYRKSHIDKALPLIDRLLKEEPDNPFFHELKGQILFENGRIKPAIVSYQKAVALLSDSALLRIAYAHALLESKDDTQLDKIIKQLTEADRLEARDPQTWRFLAAAWNRKHKITQVSYYQGLVFYGLAEESIALNKKEAASRYALRAIGILPKGSPYWLRAQDIRLETDKDPKD